MSKAENEVTVDRSRYDLNFEAIHDRIYPADIRPTDGITARIRHREPGSEFLPTQVWRLSPLGIELVHQKALGISKGAPVDLEITIAGERVTFEGLVVDLIQEGDRISLMGVRLSKRHGPRSLQDRRKSSRWLCSDAFFPTCVAPSPGRINDYMYFQIRDVSKQGLQLTCSLRNKFLIPDMSFTLNASFPTVGDVVLPVRVARVGITSSRGRDQLGVGVEFLKLTDSAKKVIGQYLIQFGNADSLDDLRKAGFVPKSAARGLEFYYLKSEKDYEQVLALRLAAHLADNTTTEEIATASDMADMNDARARIIIGKYKSKAVATARIRFNHEDAPMEHEAYVEWPKELPRREQIVEVSRVCTHPEFRRGDILASLLQFIVQTLIQRERPWVLIGSWKSMVPFYTRIGLRTIGLRHKEPRWREEQHLMLANSHETMLGKGVHPFYWNLIWRPISDHLIQQGFVVPNEIDRIRITILKALSPFARLAFWIRRRPRRRPDSSIS